MPVPDFETNIRKILDGVYARAADNNGNSEYLHDGYPDYDVDEALQLIVAFHQQEMRRIIGEDEPDTDEFMGIKTTARGWFTRIKPQTELRHEQLKRAGLEEDS